MRLKRTVLCGDLRAQHIGRNIVASGWVHSIREIGGLVFLSLRDTAGILQFVFDKEYAGSHHEAAKRLGREFVVSIAGKVVARAENQVNKDMETGEVEVLVSDLELLNTADTPPIEVREDAKVDPELRLTYRYLDLRRPSMQTMLKKRHRMVKAIRDQFDEDGFLEIETPILTKATPEGARDFVVPSRLHPGNFYALPQSPQIFKQILITAGVNKYFQIARCFRDEDKRADRQPEFTQLDMEMGFVEPADVYRAVEGCVRRIMRDMMGMEIKGELPKLPYREALGRYGSDKPDTRFAMPLCDLSAIVAQSGFGVFKNAVAAGNVVKALCIPGGNTAISKGQFKALETDAKGRGAKGLAFIRYTDQGLDSPIAKFLSKEELDAIARETGAGTGDLLIFVADTERLANQILGDYRKRYADRSGTKLDGVFNYLWVVDFPLFEYDEEVNRIAPAHHPFTAPVQVAELFALAEEIKRAGGKISPKIVDQALAIKATHYDLVLNGVELGSGSIRISRRDEQNAMFTCVGLHPAEIEERFGFLLGALRYGAPPMAGIGLGIDRWLMVLLGYDSIQDVIPFPKTASGKGLMDQSPSSIDPVLMQELCITSTVDKAQSV